MSEESATEEWVWSLSSWSVSDDGSTAITILRPVDEEERNELQAAARFLRSVGSSSTYLTAAEAIDRLLDRLHRLAGLQEDKRSQVEVDAVSAAFLQALRLVIQAADRLTDDLGEYPIPDHVRRRTQERIALVAGALAEARTLAAREPPPKVVLAASEEEAGAFALFLEEGGDDALATLQGGALTVQLMHAERLVALADEITEASLLLRRATAEVLEGAPALIRHAPVTEERPELGSLQPDDLALDRIAPIQRLIQHARELVERTEADEPLLAHRDEAGARESIDELAADDDAPDSEARDDDEPPIERGVVDLRGVAERLGQMSAELERAWSEALDQLINDEALASTRAEWESLFGAIRASAESDSVRLEELGIDQHLTAEELNVEPGTVELEPEGVKAWKQAEVAYLRAVTNVGGGAHALFEHSITQLSFNKEEGTVTGRRFWSSGAFARLRRELEVLVELHEERRLAERRVAGEAVSTRSPNVEAHRRAHLALEAINGGDPEAAVIHLAALFAIALVGGGGQHELPAEVEVTANTIRALAERLGRGAPATLGTSLLVAILGLRAAGKILAPRQPEPSDA